MAPCNHDDAGNLISSSRADFPYGTTCGLVCSPEKGPHSPLRGGSANNIYVIPAPHSLTVGTVTILAAGYCISDILSLVSIWKNIIALNWKGYVSNRVAAQSTEAFPESPKDSTSSPKHNVNGLVSKFLSTLEIPMFSAAVLAILVLGERNFFSPQVRYQTEPMASIGMS